MEKIIELIVTILGVSTIALVGWTLLLAIGFLTSGIEREDPRANLESEIGMKQDARRFERICILEEIRMLPNCPDGSLSDVQKDLWDVYHAMEAEDEKLRTQENMQLLNSKGGW